MSDYILPALLLLGTLLVLRRKESSYSLLLRGGAEGLKLLVTVAPALIVLMAAVSMLRASGAMEALTRFLRPAFAFLGIPEETAILVLVRPLSGSAALAIGGELMAAHGPDSQVGRTVAVMLGSTETTFYAISVYFGASGTKSSRYTVPAALIADMTGFVMASLTAKFI